MTELRRTPGFTRASQSLTPGGGLLSIQEGATWQILAEMQAMPAGRGTRGDAEEVAWAPFAEPPRRTLFPHILCSWLVITEEGLLSNLFGEAGKSSLCRTLSSCGTFISSCTSKKFSVYWPTALG